jgi:hypothetical protein
MFNWFRQPQPVKPVQPSQPIQVDQSSQPIQPVQNLQTLLNLPQCEPVRVQGQGVHVITDDQFNAIMHREEQFNAIMDRMCQLESLVQMYSHRDDAMSSLSSSNSSCDEHSKHDDHCRKNEFQAELSTALKQFRIKRNMGASHGFTKEDLEEYMALEQSICQ